MMVGTAQAPPSYDALYEQDVSASNVFAYGGHAGIFQELNDNLADTNMEDWDYATWKEIAEDGSALSKSIHYFSWDDASSTYTEGSRSLSFADWFSAGVSASYYEDSGYYFFDSVDGTDPIDGGQQCPEMRCLVVASSSSPISRL